MNDFLTDIHQLVDGSPDRPHAVIGVDRHLRPLSGGREFTKGQESLKKPKEGQFSFSSR